MNEPRRPDWRRYFRFLGPDVRADVDEELDFHLALRVRDLEARGMSPVAARDEALRQFGDYPTIRGAVLAIDERRHRRSTRRERAADMLTDLRLTARSLRRSPGFTTIAVLCVAVGVAASASIFTAVHGILIRPLPYPASHELIAVYAGLPERNITGSNISYWDWVSWRDENRTLEQIGLWTWNTATLSGTDDEAERVEGAQVTANLFPLLGVAPVLGRGFTPDEERTGGVVLLSHGLWQRRFAGDTAIVGRTIRVDARPYTVVGVMPPRFSFPERGQVWMPMPPEPIMDRGNRFYAGAIGRLRPGVTVDAARRDLDGIMRRLEREYPDDYSGWTAEVRSLQDDLVGDLRRPLLVFLGAVAMVLLIVCANVANLMLARGASRQRDVGIRVAMGAGRARVVRHVLLESLLIATAGGIVGALLVPLGVRFFTLIYPDDVPYYFTLGVDGVVVGFVAAISALAGLLLGLAPALRATRVDVNEILKEGGRGDAGGRQSGRVRDGLVVAELALSLILLIGATLLVRSYRSLSGTDLGFDEAGILSARVSLPSAKYSERDRRRAFWENAYARLAALPGVEAVGSANGIPFSGWNVQSTMTIEGRPARPRSEGLLVHYQSVSPDYFRAIGAPIVRGRGLTEADRDPAVQIGVINETLAEQEFRGEDPLGRRIKYGDADSQEPWMTIVGVVRDFHHWRLPEPVRPAIYLPQLALPWSTQTLVLRTSLADPFALEAGLRRVLRELDPDAPAYQVQSFEQVVWRSLWRQRMPGQVLGVFAVMAMALAAVGIYGVISYAVAQRARELGVRMALGASRGQVALLVLRKGMRLALLGVGIGLVGALLLTRVVERLLYGVAATDPLTFVTVPIGLTVIALVASLVPARRATRVDPVVAMRAD
ncbi:MAG TPA: ABC transporter permease [Gemmatimonadaceae bacterium]|nr:ABC transporter permease [Gemmatimonadaceae bacterium]